MSNNPDDLVLEPLRKMRGKPHDLIKGGTVVSAVYFGPIHDGFAHPSLNLSVRHKWQDCEDFHDTTLLNIRFLMSSLGGSRRSNMAGGANFATYATTEEHDAAFAKRKACGFMRGPTQGMVSRTFAGTIEANLRDSRHLACGLGLIDRANEVFKETDSLRRRMAWGTKGDCELLRLIMGLRLIGVEVTIRNGRKDAKFRANPPYSLVA